MVDAVDSKSTGSDTIRVQVPWLVPNEMETQILIFEFFCGILYNENRKMG